MQSSFNFSTELDLNNLSENTFRYLVIPDLHLRAKQQSNRKGILAKYNGFLEDIISLITTTRAIHGVILLGDIWDRGVTGKFSDLITPIANFQKISDLVNGNLYTLFGNHEDTYATDNPFYSFVQMPPELEHILRSKKEAPPFVAPIIKAPMQLTHSSGTIWFNHFQKKDKRYKVSDNLHPMTNIGLYHDDIITTESKAKLYHHRAGQGIDLTSDIFENIDWAICGHNHQPLEEIKIGNTLSTLVTTPGTPVQNRIDEMHTEVKIPIIEFHQEKVVNRFLTYNMGNIEETIIENKLNDKKKVMRKALKSYKLTLKKTSLADCLLKAEVREIAQIIETPGRVFYSEELFQELTNNQLKEKDKEEI